MTSGNLKWFLGLSAALHLAVLGVWTPTLTEIGQRGPVINLEMVNNAGATARPSPPAEPQRAQPAASAGPVATPDAMRPATARERPPAPPDAARPATPTDATKSASRTAAAAPPPAADIAAAAPEPANTEQHLRDTLLELVTAKLHYPTIARRRGWQGTVVLQLRIGADGQVSDLQVNASSGYPVLDRAALECLRLASIPQADRWLHGRAVDILLPVEYRLVDS